MAVKVRDWWARRGRWQQLLLLAGVACFAVLMSEGLHNLRAFTSLELKPIAVPVQAFTCESDLNVQLDAGGAHVENGNSHVVDLILPVADLQLHTVAVSLTGGGSVNVSVLLKDQASAFSLVQVYSAYCVPGDSALRHVYATAESAGTAGEVRLRFKALTDEPYTVALVTLNAHIPFQWQPVRMSLVFLLTFGLLCAVCVRRVTEAVYQPDRLSHRLAVMLPLAGVMALMLFVAVWIKTDTPLFSGISDEAAAKSTDDAYAVLYETVRAGRLAVDAEPSAALEGLNNLYDQSERVSKNVRFKFDYAYYQGHYYIYYGLAPVLTVYAPYRLLTGKVPESRDATLLMGWLAVAAIGWAVCGLVRRFNPGAKVAAVSLGCVTAVFASGTMLLMASADFYYLAELSFVAFCAASIGFGAHATLRRKSWLRLFEYAGSGLCFALSAASRPSALPMLFALLAPLYVAELARKRAGVWDAVAFLTPAALGVGALLWYNAARFGSIFDFGAKQQLTVTDVHWQTVRPAELAQALYHYLLEPLVWNNKFPYVAVGYHSVPSAGHYVFTLSNVGVLCFPVVWLLALMPLAAPRGLEGSARLRAERRWTYWLPLLVSVPLMLVSYGIAGAILRYTCDFRLFYTLPAVSCAVALMSRPASPERTALAWIAAACCLATIFIGFGLMFDNERDYILKNSPQIYYGLQRMLFPY